MKYIKQNDGSLEGVDENSALFTALKNLPKKRAVTFLDDSDPIVVDYFKKEAEKHSKVADDMLVAQATQELINELIADKLQARVDELRKKRGQKVR